MDENKKCFYLILESHEIPDNLLSEIEDVILRISCNTTINDSLPCYSIIYGTDGNIIKKKTSILEILEWIERAGKNSTDNSLSLTQHLHDELIITTINEKKSPKLQVLTKRELEILENLAKGFSTKKVADTLCISYETIRVHLKNIYKKLKIHSLVEAVVIFNMK